MPDDPKGTTPRRAQGGARRRPRFSLPPDHHDELDNERTTETIEAFLEGPAKPRRPRRRPARPTGVQRPRAIIPLDTRTDWERALRLEDARVARYGRPASILVVDVVIAPAGAEDRYAGRLGTVIRAQARETDRVARVASARFHLLLPETDEPEASALAERICRACRDVLPVPPGPTASIRTVVASARDGSTLADALRSAGARLDG